MSGYWPRSFLRFIDLDFVSVHKNARLVNNLYIIPITSIDSKTPLASCYRHITELFFVISGGHDSALPSDAHKHGAATT